MSMPALMDTTPDTVQEFRQNLYLLPTELTQHEVNEKARPGETAERRESRVQEMQSSIKLNGQHQPVLIIETPSEGDDPPTYEYVDGGSRVDAIGRLNIEDGHMRKVWCSVLDPESDLFRTACTTNIHRAGNTVLELAAICQETAERQGWKGRGSSIQVAEYLGILPSRVSEYKKIQAAAAKYSTLKTMLDDGSIASVDAALKLIAVPDSLREEVAGRSIEIAEAKAAAKEPTPIAPPSGKSSQSKSEPAAPPPPPKVTAENIQQAAREAGSTAGPRNRKVLVEFFAEKVGPAYPEPVQKFCKYFVETWAAGGGTDRRADKLFDEMVGLTIVPVAEPEPEPAPKKPMGKAASKTATAKKAAKSAKTKAK